MKESMEVDSQALPHLHATGSLSGALESPSRVPAGTPVCRCYFAIERHPIRPGSEMVFRGSCSADIDEGLLAGLTYISLSIDR